MQNLTEKIPLYSDETEAIYSLNELYDMLQAKLDELPMEYRIAFEMSRLENRNLEEIAFVLNVSTRTVERYRDKSLQILKKELKDFLPLISLYMLLNGGGNQ